MEVLVCGVPFGCSSVGQIVVNQAGNDPRIISTENVKQVFISRF